MIFAENEEKFYELFAQLKEEVSSYGYETIFAFDMENAKAKEQARKEIVAQYSEANDGK